MVFTQHLQAAACYILAQQNRSPLRAYGSRTSVVKYSFRGGSDLSEVGWLQAGGQRLCSQPPLSSAIVLSLGGKQEVMNSTFITRLVSTHNFLPDVRLHSWLHPVINC